MPRVLLTYDINGQHVAYKKRLKDAGYSDQISGTSGITNLPNTTMFHPNKTASMARDEAQSIAKSLGINLERCFAVEIDTWAGIIGEKHVG